MPLILQIYPAAVRGISYTSEVMMDEEVHFSTRDTMQQLAFVRVDVNVKYPLLSDTCTFDSTPRETIVSLDTSPWFQQVSARHLWNKQ